jgi:hypothetical protein
MYFFQGSYFTAKESTAVLNLHSVRTGIGNKYYTGSTFQKENIFYKN